MSEFPCHGCGQAIPDGDEAWLAPDGSPDEVTGDPWCPGCATPLGIAA